MAKGKKKEEDFNKFKPEDFVLTEDNKDNPKDAVIERHNVVSRFTIKDVENHRKDLEKMKDETEGQLKVCEATCENIKRNHKWVAELSANDLHAAWMYKENKDVIKKAQPKLDEIDRQIGLYDELMDILHEKFGFVKSDANVAEGNQKEDEQESEDTGK